MRKPSVKRTECVWKETEDPGWYETACDPRWETSMNGVKWSETCRFCGRKLVRKDRFKHADKEGGNDN